jgi:2-methylcitrate dehydratase
MTFQKDLAWQTLDLKYRSSISYQFARYGLALKYDLLPPEVVRQAKRCVLDALACAIGAYDAPGLPICEDVVKELGGIEEATVIGSGLRTSAAHAQLVNGFLVRFLDFNDLGGGGHNTDSIPAIIAIAEREKKGGRDFLNSVVISYELGERVKESFMGNEAGVCNDIRGGLNMPPSLGVMMGLNEDQIANAIGICACSSLPLHVLDCDLEENSMRKNLRFPWVAKDAILSCLLAKRGFTGPIRVVEGDGGWQRALLPHMNLDKMTDFSGWRILKVRHKFVPANGSSQGHLQATLEIVIENDLKPQDIASVHIKACEREAKHTTTASKKYPRNAESADHSAFYQNAHAIKYRSFGIDAMNPDRFVDPEILELIEKMTVETDPEMPYLCLGGKSEIRTKDGRTFSRHVPHPRGTGPNPLTDDELEDKFRNTARQYMPEKQMKQVIDMVWNLEQVDSLGSLMKLLIFAKR